MSAGYTCIALSAAVALVGCALTEGSVLATTDRENYARDPATGVASVDLTLHNETDAAIVSEGCAGTIPLGYVLERDSAGRWELERYNLVCVTPYIGVTLQPGEQASALLDCCADAGRYRVWLWYHAVRDPNHWDSTATAPFRVD